MKIQVQIYQKKSTRETPLFLPPYFIACLRYLHKIACSCSDASATRVQPGKTGSFEDQDSALRKQTTMV